MSDAEREAAEIVWSWRDLSVDPAHPGFWDREGRDKYFDFLDTQKQVSDIAAALNKRDERIMILDETIQKIAAGSKSISDELNQAKDGIAALRAKVDKLGKEITELHGICKWCGGRKDLPKGHVERCYCLPTIRQLQDDLKESESRLAAAQQEIAINNFTGARFAEEHVAKDRAQHALESQIRISNELRANLANVEHLLANARQENQARFVAGVKECLARINSIPNKTGCNYWRGLRDAAAKIMELQNECD